MRDFKQNDAARDAGWLVYRVRPTLQRRDRLFTEPCNKTLLCHTWFHTDDRFCSGACSLLIPHDFLYQ